MPDYVKFVAVGDIVFNNKYDKIPDGDRDVILSSFRNASNFPDIVFGNLEGPLSYAGSANPQKVSLRSDPRWLTALAEAGFNILCLANNHMLDYCSVAVIETLELLGKNGIRYI